jgi:hypothetical protein
VCTGFGGVVTQVLCDCVSSMRDYGVATICSLACRYELWANRPALTGLVGYVFSGVGFVCVAWLRVICARIGLYVLLAPYASVACAGHP